ncbi:MAG: hypothetical protein DME26_10295, partial [Verrucomicrobia bacterium]
MLHPFLWLLLAAAFIQSALAAPGDLDTGFNPTANGAYSIYSTVVQTDGKIVIGGQFFNGSQVGNGIVRLNPDGTPDIGFNPDTGGVNNTAVQADGKIIIEGNHLARLNADGTLDASFNPNPNGAFRIFGYVASTVVQADEKIVIGGSFTN